MQRNLVTLATVLSIKPLGENNSSVCLFTRTEGILYATLYGGPKSKLKSLVSTWNTGTVYLSFSKNNYKISDFDVKSYHLSFRENIFKSCAASLAAEIAMKTHCAGNYERCWALVNGFLNGLEACKSENSGISGLIRFLWRYLELLGIQPDCTSCCHCGEKLLMGAEYVPVENGFICQSCNPKKNLFVSKDGIAFLKAVSTLRPDQAALVNLEENSVGEVKSLVYYLIENACGSQLLSLKTGYGVL